MFPEGDPASAPIQEILYWQTRTIEMMYKRVGDAIKASGNQTHPTDWLIFLCPGTFFCLHLSSARAGHGAARRGTARRARRGTARKADTIKTITKKLIEEILEVYDQCT